MAQVSRKKVLISNKDLKQSILNANKRLKAQNDNLDKEVKDKKSLLSSVEKQISKENNELDTLLGSISSTKKRHEDAASECSFELNKLAKLKSQSSVEEVKTKKLLDKQDKLEDSFSSLDSKVAESSILLRANKEGLEITERDLTKCKALIVKGKQEINRIKDNKDELDNNLVKAEKSYDKAIKQFDSEFSKKQSLEKKLNETIDSLYNDIQKIKKDRGLKKKQFNEDKVEMQYQVKAEKSVLYKLEDKCFNEENKLNKIK